MKPPVLPSIHDVMPETLPQVASILDTLRAAGAEHVTLLVVPGRSWDKSGLEQLRRWQRAGCELAGHGWRHHVEGLRGFYPRMHGLLLSRKAGEHLALEPPGILALMARSHAWFRTRGLGDPSVYVPPAWAMGRLPRRSLRSQPFRFVETLSGVHDTVSGRFRRLPVVGFEADTRGRALTLSVINSLMRPLAARRPLRLAIHPNDPNLHLGRTLVRCIERIRSTADYSMLETVF